MNMQGNLIERAELVAAVAGADWAMVAVVVLAVAAAWWVANND